MECFNSIFDISIKVPTAITIGKFDGIHKGHHLLTSEILSKKTSGLSSCLITFKNSPRIVLSKDITPSLFTNKEKEYILEQKGIQYLITCPFDKKFMEIDAVKFVEILCNNLNMKYLVVGEDFSFGYKRSGNINLLRKLSKNYGFELKVIEKIKKDNQYISSTLIREELIKGEIENVNDMLGYEYFILCEVFHYTKNKMGIPTLYIIPPKNKLIPKFGIYITTVHDNGKKYKGITKIGKNILDIEDCKLSEDDIGIETYMLDFVNVGDHLFGKVVKLSFVKLLDDKMKFCSYIES
jgi:riboflavin kinase/FMN adenylyltransferase